MKAQVTMTRRNPPISSKLLIRPSSVFLTTANGILVLSITLRCFFILQYRLLCSQFGSGSAAAAAYESKLSSDN